jgi:hypothetical protein
MRVWRHRSSGSDPAGPTPKIAGGGTVADAESAASGRLALVPLIYGEPTTLDSPACVGIRIQVTGSCSGGRLVARTDRHEQATAPHRGHRLVQRRSVWLLLRGWTLLLVHRRELVRVQRWSV